MIHSREDYRISCNKCHKSLEYSMDSNMVTHRGHLIYEDTVENIEEVAKDMGWDIKLHLCTKCRDIESKTIRKTKHK